MGSKSCPRLRESAVVGGFTMLPKRPPRDHRVGFIYAPPYRIQGISIGGEQTIVQVPELGLNFDIGLAPRIAITAPFVALSHGHMDHVAALPYYFSQRVFMKMTPGTCVCHPDLAGPLNTMMQGWIQVENQQTTHTITALAPGDEIQIKPSIVLRAIEAKHTVPALSFAVIENRSKLREEFAGMPQSELRRIRGEGREITQVLKVPLVAYTGDTEMNENLVSTPFNDARIVITECTFFDDEHVDRAKVGKHLHINQLKELMQSWKAEMVVIIHTSRRTHLEASRRKAEEVLGDEAQRICFLMDHHRNRQRYEEQESSLGEEKEGSEPPSNG
jgi:ribonuclease Z